LAVLAVLVWAAVVVPDWPTRIVALVVIALVPASVFWGVRTARKEDQAARESTQGTPAD
jgi:negative regulator of sigma E activity